MRCKLELCILLAVMAAGCASWQKQGVLVSPPYKLKVAILPLELDFKVKNPRDLETVTSTTASSAEQKQAAEAIKTSLRDVLAHSLEVRISSSYVFSPISHDETEAAMERLAISTSAALAAAQYQRLAISLNAAALLRTRIHGYGRIKGSWISLLVASGFGEGAAQGVIVAEAAGNIWAAVGVAVEEVLQECTEWLGGGYLFNRFYAPVILEGDLVSGKTGKTLWGRWFIVTENKPAVQRLPKSEQGKKEIRLLLTFEKARDEMVQNLELNALKNEEFFVPKPSP